LAHEGLGLASRISGLSGKVRELGSGRVAIPEPLRQAAADTAGEYDTTGARLELEWASLGARAASGQAALRAAEETAFSEVSAEMTDCVEQLAAAHVEALNAAEAKARDLIEELV